METTQCHSLTQQRLQAQRGIKHKCGWASALQIQTKVWQLKRAIPQLGMHFDKHVSHGHKPFSNFLDDPLFRRTCSPMPLLLNIPPFSSSDCFMHFTMPIDFKCCTLLMLAGPPWRVWAHSASPALSSYLLDIIPEGKETYSKNTCQNLQKTPQGGLNFSLAVARASQRGTGKAK